MIFIMHPHVTNISRKETLVVIALVALYLVVNLATSSRFPAVWDDEVMFADPGVNLYLGHGFTSSAWFFQPRDEFWAGNTPLYSVLLSVWLRLFGFSLESVRSLGYVLMAASTLTLWWSTIRHGLIASARARVLFVVVLLLEYGCAFMYRTGRYDTLGLFLVALAALAASIGHPAVRCFCLGGIALLVPLTMVALCVYAAVIGTLLLLFGGRTFWKEVASIVIGLAAGTALLYGIYRSQGVWDDFTRTAEHLRTMGMGRGFSKEPGLFLLLVTCMLLAIRGYSAGERNWRTPFGFGLAVGVLFPVVMYILGRFPTYNAWMAVIPLVLGLFSRPDLDTWSDQTTRILIGTLLMLVCLSGLPLQLAVAVFFWKERDYARVEELVDRNVGATDWVFCDAQAYYAAKRRAATVFTSSYHRHEDPQFSPEEKERITVLIIPPKVLESTTRRLGGVWTSNGDRIAPPRKEFLFFSKRLTRQLGLARQLINNYNIQVYIRK